MDPAPELEAEFLNRFFRAALCPFLQCPPNHLRFVEYIRISLFLCGIEHKA